MVFNGIYNNIHTYRGLQIYWWEKPEYPEKTIDLLTNFITHSSMEYISPEQAYFSEICR
jgi:hypothetical protein